MSEEEYNKAIASLVGSDLHAKVESARAAAKAQETAEPMEQDDGEPLPSTVTELDIKIRRLGNAHRNKSSAVEKAKAAQEKVKLAVDQAKADLITKEQELEAAKLTLSKRRSEQKDLLDQQVEAQEKRDRLVEAQQAAESTVKDDAKAKDEKEATKTEGGTPVQEPVPPIRVPSDPEEVAKPW